MWHFLAAMWRRLRPQRLLLVLITGALLVDIAFDAAFPLSFKFLIDDAILPRNGGRLALILGVLIGSAVVFAAATIAVDYLAARISTDLVNGIRLDVFRHLQRLPVEYFERTGGGDITARFSGDLGAVENALGTPLPVAVLSALGLLISLGLLFALQWELALIAAAGLPLAALGPRLIGHRATGAAFELREEQGRLADVVQENVTAQPVIKAFGLEAAVIRSFARRLSDLRPVGIRSGFLVALLERVPNLTLLAFHLAAIWVGSWLAFRGAISIGALAAFNAILINMSLWLNSATYALPEVVRAAAGYRRLEEILAEASDVVDEPAAKPVVAAPSRIEVRDVSFRYADGRTALSAVNLTIPRGAFVGIVGPSGSGKSTLVRLLLRFQDPHAGALLLDDRDLRAVSQASWRDHIGVVFQENVLFDATIRENIRVGKEGASDAEIHAAVRDAELSDLVDVLPDGLDTIVGPRGGRLSGGERQRVALARAIVRSPDLLILDEATSALDPRTEAMLNRTIDRLRPGRTVVSATHRLSSVVHADLIVVMSKGRIEESGTHIEMLERHGLYRRLWEKQGGIVVDAAGTTARVEPERLGQIPMLAVLDAQMRAEVSDMLVTRSVETGAEIFAEGDPADTFYLIAHGKVELLRTVEGERRRIATLDDGDHFGEIALVQSSRRGATVRALSPTLLLTLQRDQFLDLIGRSEALRTAIEAAIRDRT